MEVRQHVEAWGQKGDRLGYNAEFSFLGSDYEREGNNSSNY